jgi:hypothetical protein
MYILDKIMHYKSAASLLYYGLQENSKKKDTLISFIQEMFCVLETVLSCVTEHYNLVRSFCMLGRIPLALIMLSGMLVRRKRSWMN